MGGLLFCLLLVRIEGCELGRHRRELGLNSVLGLKANCVRGGIDERERVVVDTGAGRRPVYLKLAKHRVDIDKEYVQLLRIVEQS